MRLIIAQASLDGIGIYGQVLHWTMIIALMGSAFLAMLYFWKKGLIDWGESSKFEMLQQDDFKEK